MQQQNIPDVNYRLNVLEKYLLNSDTYDDN